MTACDLQSAAKQKGHPWSIAKGLYTFCPISRFIEKEKIELSDTKLWLKVDDKLQQDDSTKDMIFSVPYLISYISHIFSLEIGDVILTGTLEGVGPVKPGQVITAGIKYIIDIKFPVTYRKN